jgi:hypothetical protein
LTKRIVPSRAKYSGNTYLYPIFVGKMAASGEQLQLMVVSGSWWGTRGAVEEDLNQNNINVLTDAHHLVGEVRFIVYRSSSPEY